ncbi:MAG: hypothetical protein HY909_07315, partial [Deltaproteobacteria bacterium]|nr:hypothetical protein [Deltaproteobacteria bacterium]
STPEAPSTTPPTPTAALAPRASPTPQAPSQRERPPRADALLAEGALLAEAHRALVQGRPSEALAALRGYRARFPAGALRPESQVEEVLALCAAGRGDDARALARRFLRAHPRSALAPRVEGACAAPGDAAPRGPR